MAEQSRNGAHEALAWEISLRSEESNTDYLYNDIGILFYVYDLPTKGAIVAHQGEPHANA